MSTEDAAAPLHGRAGATGGPSPSPASAPAHAEARHVLVIEDDASLRGALVAYLRLGGGHTVTEAERGDAGVRAFAATTVDLVVTDLEMPGLSGWEVARAVRTQRPTVPVVLITGDADAVKADPSLRALVDAILLKPFGLRALLEVIRGLTMPSRSEEVPEPTAPGAGVGDPGASRQLSVLLVEDNPGDARLIREFLRDHPGVRIVAVDTLARALTQLADPTTDLVLLDLGLPDSQGVDTVTRVVHDHPTLPVIVVTGHEDTALAQATATAGAADYLVKGAMEPAQLLRAIQAALARKRSLGEGHAPS